MEENTIKKIGIRDAGKDEAWLQDLIYENPSLLGLGDLEGVKKEDRLSSGGRLDMLLKNLTDNSMYEVEVMLGETDPSHIIRTIEYWDIEKRRYPQRKHHAVLVAEGFNKRYFNVIHILSLNVPMIAIKVEMLEIGGQQIPHFTKIIDDYEEPAEDRGTSVVNETAWAKDANWTLQTAYELRDIINNGEQTLKLNFTKDYIALVSNRGNAYWLCKRLEPKSKLGFKEKNEEKAEAITTLFMTSSISFTYKSQEFLIDVDKDFIKKHKDVFCKIHDIRYTTNGGTVGE